MESHPLALLFLYPLTPKERDAANIMPAPTSHTNSHNNSYHIQLTIYNAQEAVQTRH